MILKRTHQSETIAMLNEPVQALHHNMYPEKFKKYEYEAVKAHFDRIINHECHHFYICIDNDEPIGYIWFEEVRKEETAFSSASCYLYVQQISVNDSHRGRGIGKILFNSALDHANKMSINRIGLDYWVKNTIAKNIYENMGFVLEKEITYLTL